MEPLNKGKFHDAQNQTLSSSFIKLSVHIIKIIETLYVPIRTEFAFTANQ